MLMATVNKSGWPKKINPEVLWAYFSIVSFALFYLVG
jgi:hypothetical protein